MQFVNCFSIVLIYKCTSPGELIRSKETNYLTTNLYTAYVSNKLLNLMNQPKCNTCKLYL